MATTDLLLQKLHEFLPLGITLLCVSVLLWFAHLQLIKRNADLGNEKLFAKQLNMLGLTLVGVLAVILALPVSDSSRNQIIALVGLVISGIIAFSSGTIFANLLAGIMLRITKPFRTGDFIAVGDYFGRVVERGLLDTEIQTETRDLVALPNIFMSTHPISVTSSSGTIISITLSLGFDVHHALVEKLLTEATVKCELTDGFVHIIELGDFSVVYKVSGKLEEVKSLISARSRLNRAVLDVLHDNQIEIMSPNFISTRPVAVDTRIIPARQRVEAESLENTIEDVVFDKAEAAHKQELKEEKLVKKIKVLKEKVTQEPDSETKKALKENIDALNVTKQKIKLKKSRGQNT